MISDSDRTFDAKEFLYRFAAYTCAPEYYSEKEWVEVIDRFTAELTAHLSRPAVPEMQPMETFPKDGRNVLVRYQLVETGHEYWTEGFFNASECRCNTADGCEGIDRPLGWAPLPGIVAGDSVEQGWMCVGCTKKWPSKVAAEACYHSHFTVTEPPGIPAR